MPNPTIDDLILNYNHYNTLTKKFNKKPYYEYSEKFDVVLKYAESEEWKRDMYDPTYEEVYRHLSDDGIMLVYMEQGCKYISYLLHKQVKDVLKYSYNLETFNILKKYVEYFYKYKGRSRNNCLQHILYVDEDIYEKLDTLYRLYDRYTNVLSSYNSWDKNKCSFFKLFVNEYNEYIKNNKPTSLDLNKILEHFKSYVNNTKTSLNGKCEDYNYFLEKIELYKPPNEQKPAHIPELESLQPQALQNEVNNPVKNPVVNPVQRTTNIEVNQLELLPNVPPASELEYIATKSDIEQGGESELVSGRNPESVIKEFTLSEPQEQELHHYGPLRTHVPDETMGQSGYRTKVESPEQLVLKGDQLINPLNRLENDQGFMENMRNAITGFLGEVDPVPVVGVSEEADVDNESLIDSMENIQNFFQDFKDMEMDIFQMIDLI
ncbi:hypothetical protein PVBG_05491 [Plasmodium vivax Brazil I]|uniref:Uncharacterized protein n=1 Tax=Plasmodium vivax (strain Brazil I) TaxID=1033975 RepID=A0A0J9SVE7_PLAV1|nr:hypothetical protein PVBG_05491 [Plasmodium vivax Brazil I]